MVKPMNRHNLFTSNSKKDTNKKDRDKNNRRAVGTILFLTKLSCLALFLILLFGKVIMPQYLYSYNASLLDKMEHLATLSGPKIVLIGNSNLAFGIRSDLLEEAFHMPVVNMGLHGSLGNAFHEEMAKLHVNEGDIIIVAHTEYDDDDLITDPVIAWLTLENHPALWKLVRAKDIPSLYFSYPDYAKRCLTLWTSRKGNEANYGDAYSRMSFNEYGDVSFDRPGGRYDQDEFFEMFTIKVPSVGETCTNRLNRLNQYITEHGGIMLIAAYPVVSSEHTPPAEEYVAFQKKLSSSLDCPVISDFTDYFLDFDCFYDTPYHLTNEGCVLRTNQLILDLRSYLETLQPHSSPSS